MRLSGSRTPSITIKMWRGVLEDVEGLPPGWLYRLVDLDVHPELKERPPRVEPKTVRITVKSGIVWNVSNLPPGYAYEEVHVDEQPSTGTSGRSHTNSGG